MCGRFSLGLAADELEHLDGYPDLQSQVGNWVNHDDFVSRYNVAPRSQAPVIRRREPSSEELVLQTMKWGLVPHWSNKEDTNLSTINARAESLVESGNSGIWGSVKGKRRCVVPAQGCLKKGKERVPYFTKRKDGKLVLFAGLYDVAHIEGRSEPLYTFTIVTTSAPPSFSWLHDRQPVILDSPSSISTWLDTQSEGWTKQLSDIVLNPISDAEATLECYAVPKEVGKVGNGSPTFIRPIEERKGGLEDMFSKQAKMKTEVKMEARVKEDVQTRKGEKRNRADSDGDEMVDTRPSKAPKKEEDTEVEIVEPLSSQGKMSFSSQDRSTPKKVSPGKAAKKCGSGEPKITVFFGKKS